MGSPICVSCGEDLGDAPGDDCEHEDDHVDVYEDSEDDGIQFADPGGRSALRAATPTNPRNLPCPTCRWKKLLAQLEKVRDDEHTAQARFNKEWAAKIHDLLPEAKG